MFCPACASKDLRVLDSRPSFDINQIKRRRECIACGYRFSTVEEIESKMPKIIKKSGSLTEFDVDKVRRGVMRSVEKRPVSLTQLDGLIQRIVSRINKMQVKHLRSEQVGYIIIEELKNVDLVAMIRFASVYHAFKDAESFIAFISEHLCRESKIVEEYEKE
jgi:transcriptional repressor NrdR